MARSCASASPTCARPSSRAPTSRLDGTTVAKLAEDELYIIRFLTKGRVAPDLVGVDSANRPLSLAANKGKVIVLLFWNSNVPDAKRVVEITTGLSEIQGPPASPSSA